MAGQSAMMRRTRISAIIPALNEEKHIGRILSQLSQLKDSFDIEIIVGDDGSTDKTVEIARCLATKVIIKQKGTKGTIASNRNRAARVASGELLVFFDADTEICDPKGFMDSMIDAFSDEKVVAAMPSIEVAPRERIWKDSVFHPMYNRMLSASFKTPMPFSSGQCQAIRRSAFDKVGGYDENLVHGEDTMIFRKLRRIGRIVHLTGLTIYESPRRYRKHGYIRLAFKSLGNYAYRGIFKKDYLKGWERVD